MSASTKKAPTNRADSSSAGPSSSGDLTLDENRQLIQYAAYVIVGAVIVSRLIFPAMFALYILAFPLGILYLVQTCPTMESFDAKKELKRVLRGADLPDDDPNKPKGFLGITFARIGAAVTTELATGMGYQVEMVTLGVANVATVRVPSAKMDCYWVGVVGRWFYVLGREIPEYKYE